MDYKFSELIKQWLEKPETERDYPVGTIYLFKLVGNHIMYKNIIINFNIPFSAEDSEIILKFPL